MTYLNRNLNAVPVYQVDATGNIVSNSGGAANNDPSTGTNQTNGGQKTQVVDSSGAAVPFATSAGQTTGNNILGGISAQLPASLGTKTGANSLPVTLASDGPQSTAALQTAGNNTLSTISGQIPASLGAKTTANSLSVTLSSDGTYATAANQTTLINALNAVAAQLPASLGAKTTAASLSIGFATDALLPIQGNVANNAADSGNPIKIGGVLPGGTNRININSCALAPNFATSSGTALLTCTSLVGSVAGNHYAINPIDHRTDAISASFGIGQGNVPVVGYNEIFNGSTWDRQRGDITGTWVHAPQNTVSTSLSGTISASGGTATVAFINTARQEVINSSTATLWASWGTPAVNGAGSFAIAVGGSYSTDRTTGTLTILSSAANQPYTVNRFA